jgi:DNA (cytosine-5)-methyltransferase 1
LTEKKTFLEFFAGIGLLRWALQRDGWTCRFANDISPDKKALYDANFDGDEYVRRDIWELDADEVPSADLAAACFPCTDLSLAGKRKGLSGHQSGTFWAFTQLLDRMADRRPPFLLIENVPGFLTSNRGADFLAAITELNRLGYRCDPLIIDAARFVPQSRQRLFVVGALDSAGVMPPFSEALLMADSELRPKALCDFVLSHRELKWSIGSLASLPSRPHSLDTVLENLPDNDASWWSRDRVNHLLSQMTARHRSVVEAMMAKRKYSFATAYRRMRNGLSMAEVRNDGVSGCLRTPRGGSSRQILIKAGYGKISVRYMTAREYARLQGVEDSYVINVAQNRGLFGFGDAVCVPVIRWIASQYLDPLLTARRNKGPSVPSSDEQRWPTRAAEERRGSAVQAHHRSRGRVPAPASAS